MTVIIAFMLGLAAISVGVGMIYLPAGIIAAGVGLVALSFILSRGSAPEALDIRGHSAGYKQEKLEVKQ